MELYKELLVGILDCCGKMEITFPQLEVTDNIVEGECYKILEKIVEIIRDDTLDDPECFWKIEKIVKLFQKYHIRCGGRHDF